MLLTDTRLIELRTVANQCQDLIDKNQGTILERDYVDLYNLLQDYSVECESKLATNTFLNKQIALLFGSK